MDKEDIEYQEFKRKYKKKLASALGDKYVEPKKVTTSDYENFKKAFLPKNLSLYEKGCNIAEKIMPITPDKKNIPKIEEAIRISHLNVSPTGTMSFAAMAALILILTSVILGYIVPFILTQGRSADNFFFIFFGAFIALVLFIPLSKLPFIISNAWRMKASNQMVLSIFYVVTYMRHTPNLELAIDFAAEHLAPPLSLDLKKVIWDIETGKFDNVTESLDFYLRSWDKWNPEFIESMHLVESSLYETSESRRMNALDKSLQVILDETYEKMLHFTHDLKSPITTLHMLGIVLPILGLVILPLLTAFVPEVKWYHLFALYNLAIPILVYYLGKEILSTRPTGYGGIDVSNLEPSVTENNRVTIKFKGSKSKGISLTPMAAATGIFCILLFIGIMPLLLHAINPNLDYYLADGRVRLAIDVDPDAIVQAKFLDYRDERDASGIVTGRMGPYGLGASILSLAIPLSFGLAFGLYYNWKYSKLTKLRKKTASLEQEFANALFQLGNRLGDGVPAEVAFGIVAKNMEGTESGKFFDMVTVNIVKLGMGVEEAIFDKEVGALQHFPSSIIESSMKVFIESIKKGPLIASQALITIAEYIKSMHRVDERLKDLMADIVSSMKSQVSFLTPAISGVVVGITSMISQILGSLGERIGDLDSAGGAEMGAAAGLIDMFGGGGIPTYYFQAIVGLYVVQITYILTVLISGIQSGGDKINEKNSLGKSLIGSTVTYVAIAGFFTIAFSMIASGVISGITN